MCPWRAPAACWLRSYKPPLLLGSSRLSGTYALYNRVHAGGEVVEGGETVHTNVFFDSTHSAFLMQVLRILICVFT